MFVSAGSAGDTVVTMASVLPVVHCLLDLCLVLTAWLAIRRVCIWRTNVGWDFRVYSGLGNPLFQDFLVFFEGEDALSVDGPISVDSHDIVEVIVYQLASDLRVWALGDPVVLEHYSHHDEPGAVHRPDLVVHTHEVDESFLYLSEGFRHFPPHVSDDREAVLVGSSDLFLWAAGHTDVV